MRVIGFALALALSTLATTSAEAASCSRPGNLDALRQAVGQQVNGFRQQNGRSAASRDRRLSQAAMRHACDLASSGRFNHRGTSGTNSQQRAAAQGYGVCKTGENLAWGYPDPRRIVAGWARSAGHRRIMLGRDFDEYGVGVAMGAKGPVWVMVMAKSC